MAAGFLSRSACGHQRVAAGRCGLAAGCQLADKCGQLAAGGNGIAAAGWYEGGYAVTAGCHAAAGGGQAPAAVTVCHKGC